MKLFTKTFGCQMNFADSDEMGRHLKERGFVATENESDADAILVNTCTVRDLAEHKAFSFVGRLKDWKQSHPDGFVVVTGCAAERAKQDFKRKFPHVDLIVGAKDIEKFPDELDLLMQQRVINEEDLIYPSPNPLPLMGEGNQFSNPVAIMGEPNQYSNPLAITEKSNQYFNPLAIKGEPNQNSNPLAPEGERARVRVPVVSYVPIMRGCNYNCTYCIVPSVRGREVYLPVEKILQDVSDRVKEGAKEVWLLGQTVNSYRPLGHHSRGSLKSSSSNVVIEDPRLLMTMDSRFRGNDEQDEQYDFADLLRDVNQVPGLERLRFISPHPYYLSPKLIRAMAESKTVCEHMHLPVQSGSNEMLKKMKRNYTREAYLSGLKALRQAIPGIAISTDLIVGFPGETETDFESTLTLVKEADFDSAYCFKYSPRPGTVSAAWEDDIPDEEKERRVNKLLEIVDAQGAEKVKRLIGTTQEVLIEDDKGEGVFRGKTRGAWRVRVTNPTLKPGDIVSVRITGTHSRELHGEVVQKVLSSL